MNVKLLSSTAGFVFILVLAVCFIRTFYNDTNECQMTYMYQYPRFVELDLTFDTPDSYKNYGLYAYGEGNLYKKAVSNNFTGIPILFIPGHSGSYRQSNIRSLASISMRKITHIFDYFAVDSNGELSAFSGDLLIKQTDFVAHCIKRILSLYKNKHSSVILIGHSMGGIIARGLFMSKIFNSSEVNLIVTLATPHTPVLSTDWQSYFYYKNLYEYWQTKKSRNTFDVTRNDWNITLVSIGGGYRDFQVRPGLFYTNVADINVVTTAIPGVGVSMDHLCILWCKSFIEILARMLYDVIDEETETLPLNKTRLLKVLRYHLIQRTDGKRYVDHPKQLELIRSQYVYELTALRGSVNGTELYTYAMIRLFDIPSKYEYLFIRANNLALKDWIGVCKTSKNEMLNSRLPPCDPIINLSENGFTGYDKKNFAAKYIEIYIPEWIRRNMTHVIVQLPACEDPMSIDYDIYEKAKRTVPEPTGMIFLKDTAVIEKTENNALFYRIPLPEYTTLRVLETKLTPLNCSNLQNRAVLRHHVPWNYEDSHVIVKSSKPASLKFFRQTPNLFEKKEHRRTYLYLYLDPACIYSLHVRPVHSQTLVLTLLQFGSTFISYLAVVMLLCLRRQVCSMEKTGVFPSIEEGLKLMEPAVLLLHFIRVMLELWPLKKTNFWSDLNVFTDIAIPFVPKTFILSLDKPNTDLQILLSDDAYTTEIPIILHVLAYTVIHAVRVVLKTSIVNVCKLLNKFHVRTYVRSFTRYATMEIPAVPVTDVWTVIIGFLAWNSCSGTFFIGGLLYYFLKLCTFYEDNLQFHQKMVGCSTQTPTTTLLKNEQRDCHHHATPLIDSDDDKLREIEKNGIIKKTNIDELKLISNCRYVNGAYNFHFTLFIMWCILTIVSLPPTITWYYNFWYSDVIEPDYKTKIVILGLIMGSTIWSVNAVYNETGLFTKCFTYVIFLCAVKQAVTSVNIYCMPLLFNFIITLMSVYWSNINNPEY